MLITAFIETNQKPEGSSNPVRIVGRSDNGIELEGELPPGQVFTYWEVDRTERVEVEEVLAGYKIVPPDDWDGYSTILPEPYYETEEKVYIDETREQFAVSVPVQEKEAE